MSPLVLLKPGADGPPLFIAPGLGTDAKELLEIARQVQSGGPIYGLQTKGLAGEAPPDDRIEDMARYFLQAITDLQPRGPHCLVGFSLGGLVMLEVAQCLFEQRQPAALLVLLDSYPYPGIWPRQYWISQKLQRVNHHRIALAKLPLSQYGRYLAGYFDRLVTRIKNRFGAAPSTLQQVRGAGVLAAIRYRPRFYPGKITFFRAKIARGFPDDPISVWGQLAEAIVIHTIACDHMGLVSTHIKDAADQLSLCLKAALCSKAVAADDRDQACRASDAAGNLARDVVHAKN